MDGYTSNAPAAETALPTAPAPVWKVGVYLSLSGADAALGAETKEGIDLAIDEINAGGGVRGRRIQLVYADDHSDKAATKTEVLALIQKEQVMALLGEHSPQRAWLGAIVADSQKVPMIATYASAPLVTKVGQFVFRACSISPSHGLAAARFVAADPSKKKVAILSVRDADQSAQLAKVFREEVRRLGRKLVHELEVDMGEQDFVKKLRALAEHKPDVVYVPVPPWTMSFIARQAKEIGLPGSLFLGTEGWDVGPLLQVAGAELEGAHFTNEWSHDTPWPRAQAFAAAYQQRYHHAPSILAATGYDAALILTDALKRAQGETSADLRDAIRSTRGVAGVTGEISINEEGDAEKDLLVLEVTKGRPAYVTSVKVSAPPTTEQRR